MKDLAARVFGTWIHWVDRASVRADLIAGLLGALLVLPQGIAFATLAGLPPEYGLYTAVVPCIVAALFGSSWHVVSGPTNANSLALFATLAPLAVVGSPAYIALALAVTVLVGTMQFVIGALRLGTIANFISPAALRGFMSGASALIAIYALPDLLGLPPPTTHRLANARRASLDGISTTVAPAACRRRRLHDRRVAAAQESAAAIRRTCSSPCCSRPRSRSSSIAGWRAERRGSPSSGRSRRSGRGSRCR